VVRLLAHQSARRRAVSLVLASLAAAIAVSLSATAVLAASPSPQASPLFVDPLDPRAGSGASPIGSPLLAAIVVIGAAIAVSVATTLYVRWTARP
jgi:hypothetical protein